MLLKNLTTSIDYIRQKTKSFPKIGIILGSSLGNLVENIKIECSLDYSDIPHFPQSTVEGHEGKLIFGNIKGKQVVAMSGRFHYYEGYSMQEVVYGVRVMKLLGIKTILISNISGSVNENIEEGEIVLIRDHINLLGNNPLIGKNETKLGIRFPDMLETYDKHLLNLGQKIGKKLNIKTHLGVYVALHGPSLETPAEYKMMNLIGADIVGMSTVPEVIAAKHLNLTIFAASMVSNKCFPIETIKPTTIELAFEVVNKSSANLQVLFEELIHQITI